MLTACSSGASESSDVVVRGDAGATPTATSTTSATARATATATAGTGACPTYFAYDWTVTEDRRGTTRVVTFQAPTNPAGWSTFTDQSATDSIQWILTGKSGTARIYTRPPPTRA
ncbi:MAG: hypothetical protein KGP12_02855 [Actinomycetales bacterium]|nr:hypothetical protein [Actinomycetales bacterium]